MLNGQQVHDQTYKTIVLFTCLSYFSLSVGTAPLTLSSLLLLAIWLLSGRFYTYRADWLEQEWFLPVSALFILPWVAILWSSAPVDQAFKFAERSHYWLFAFIAATIIKSDRTLRSVMICFISGTAIIAIMRFLHLHGIIPKTAYLEKSFAGSYITYSLLVVMAVALLAFFYKETSTSFGRVWTGALMVGLVLALTQLNGRSGYLALALLAPWICTTMFAKRSVLTILCGVLLMCILMLTSHRVRERVALIPLEIKQYQSGNRSETAVGERFMIWKDAVGIFMQHPFIGAGTGTYQHEANKINPANKRPHPHNSYLFIAANFGLLGIGLYGWLLVVTLKRAWRSRNNFSGYSILVFLSVILIGSLTDTQILSTATGIALGFAVGIPTPPSTECAS